MEGLNLNPTLSEECHLLFFSVNFLETNQLVGLLTKVPTRLLKS